MTTVSRCGSPTSGTTGRASVGRSYGNENWQFDALGYMAARHASINDLAIAESDRLLHWDAPGPRPVDHPGLTELGV